MRLPPVVNVMGTTTRTEYKLINCVFKKRKVRLCVMGNQQKEGVHYQLGELYAPLMKAAEVRLFVALAAKHRLNLTQSRRSSMAISVRRRSTCVRLIGGLSRLRTGMHWS